MANGVPAKWKYIGETIKLVGAPTIILVMLVWKIAPPLVDSHTKFLDASTEALPKLTKSIESIPDLDESIKQLVIEVEEETQVFMENVNREHQKAAESNRRQEAALDEHDKKLDVVLNRKKL